MLPGDGSGGWTRMSGSVRGGGITSGLGTGAGSHPWRGAGASGAGRGGWAGCASAGAGRCRLRSARRGAGPYPLNAAPTAVVQPRVGTMTWASPSITGLPATVQMVLNVARFFSASIAVTSTVAVTVWPIFTGARNFSVWPR